MQLPTTIILLHLKLLNKFYLSAYFSNNIKKNTMKKIWFTLLLFFCLQVDAQVINDRNLSQNANGNSSSNRFRNNQNTDETKKKLYNYDVVERKPVFPYGGDTLRSIYLSNFLGFDSLATKAIDKADTGKYIRVHFEYILDEYGIAYEPKFLYIGSTRYASGSGDKKLKYFDENKAYFQDAVTKMIHKLPTWKPALQNGQRVHCIVKDYFQFWLGMGPEPL